MDELRLFVGNLGSSTTRQALEDYFSRYSKVTGLDLILKPGSEWPQGYAFVKMTTPQEVMAVLAACPHQLKGKRIVVRLAYSRISK